VPTATTLVYEKIAQLIERQILSGALRTQDRIPSVREMSRTAGVSVSTVVQAYLRLESAGLIEARAKSGFYVSALRSERLRLPRERKPRSVRPRSVAGEVLDTSIEAMRRVDVLPLSGAVSAPVFYPNRRLSQLTREILKDYPLHAGEFVLPPGDLELRRQIAKRMTLAGSPTDPEEVVITSGALDAITLSLRALCRAGDTVLVESPTFFGILQAIEYAGLKVVEVPNRAGTGIDIEGIRRAIRATKVTAAVLMPTFNNPTGSLTSAENKRTLVKALCGARIPIIEDDVYGDLYFSLRRPPSLRSFDESGLVVSCGSISKTVALGFRIGWAVSSQFHGEIARAKFFSSVACPTLQQKVIARYFASGGYERHLRRLRQTISANAGRMIDAIARHFPAETHVARPAGGMVVWVELPRGVDGIELFRTALANQIGIYPGVVFSATADYRNYIRLNCGLEWTLAVDRAIERLGKAVMGQKPSYA
jgi:DNA-binding transcriptional MocR family regulator